MARRTTRKRGAPRPSIPEAPIPDDGNWTREAKRAWCQWYTRTHGNQFDPRQVIAEARASRANHVIWQWGVPGLALNDRDAAIEYQVIQLRQEVRMLRIEYEEVAVPAFVKKYEGEGVYEEIAFARTTRSYDEKRDLLIDEIVAIRQAVNRVEKMAHGLEVTDVMDDLKGAVDALLSRVRPTIDDAPRGTA